MNWPRLKWILIAMLALGNLLLAGLYLHRRYEARQDTERFENALLSVLSARGVTLAPEVREQLFADTRRLYVLRDTERERELAMSLLGPAERRDLGGRFHEYENASGRAVFQGGGQFRIEWAVPPRVRASAEEDAILLLQKAGFPVDPPPTVETTPDGPTVTSFQVSDGRPVFDAYVRVQYENGAAVSMSGQWMWGVPLPAEGEEAGPVLGATLLRFTDRQSDADTPVSRVESAQPGYILSAGPSDYIGLVPVWRITADGNVYYVDAETGAPVATAYEPQ